MMRAVCLACPILDPLRPRSPWSTSRPAQFVTQCAANGRRLPAATGAELACELQRQRQAIELERQLPVDIIKKDDDGNVVSVNMDIKNPIAAEALEHMPREQLVEGIVGTERRILEIMGEIKKVLAGAGK